MPRFALFTTECVQLGDALTEIITRHQGNIAAVVTSDIYGSKQGGVIAQTRRNFARSGPGFVQYLAASFLAYPWVVRADRILAPLRRGRRVRRSVAELCDEYDIRHIHTANVNDREVVTALHAEDIDFIVVYWFDQILREQVITIPRRAVINVHAAYLPRCRGLFPGLYSALEHHSSGGIQPFGITAHLIQNREIDAGPILAQRTAHPPKWRSALFYDSWVNRVGVEMLDSILSNFDGHLASAVPQRGGSYYSYPQREHLEAARQQGLRLVSLRDFLAVLRGTNATMHEERATERSGELR
jgi:methionyl-tRNA formyltransferase